MTKTVTDRTTRAVTIEVPNKFPFRTFDGETVFIPFGDMTPEMLVTLLKECSQRVLNDGIGSKDLSEADKLAKSQKRIDAWVAGSFHVTQRGNYMESAMFDAYRAEVESALGALTEAAWNKFRLDTVKQDKGAVRWDAFIEARAFALAKRPDETRNADEIALALNEKFEAAALVLLAEKAKAINALDTTGLDF